ncbi:MAG TPA: 2-hydroxychromene-2-carboxylate isomerase [Myxococcota bacterium]|nr:2-hydroxychromene-2-carboxylate isomerase [Myxococcota bacterium]
MPGRLEFFFDYTSPFSYLADTQLPGIARRTGAEIAYRPMFLGGVMHETGNQPPAALPARARYLPTDIGRWVTRYGIEFAFNPHFPLQTLPALRAAYAAQDAGVFPAYHSALFRAAWAKPRNLSDTEVLRSVIAEAGLDPAPLLAAAASESLKARLKASTAEAVARGAFGAPTLFVGSEMFFGNDRLEFVEEALAAL